jgi:progressive ankylosis protein
MGGVILCSGLRSLYQGVIINHLETKWITWGVIIRLLGMFAAANYLIFSGYGNSSMAGALIFLTGMAIESFFSVWRGHSLIKADKDIDETPISKKEISSFYIPMVFYLSFQTILIPLIYALLSKVQHVHLGMASFALAFSITNLVLSFFMYTHQLVLQFYEHNKQAVIKSVIVFSIVPSLLLAMLSFTPAGTWMMKTVLGANDVLAAESLAVLKFFIIKTLVFPWVDYFGGILMLQKSTKSLLKPQLLNIISVVILLVPMVYLYPELNGKAGAIAASAGELAGLLAVYLVVSKRNMKGQKKIKQLYNLQQQRK